MKFKIFSGNSPKLEWQKLKSKQKNIPDLHRTAIPGGWLVTTGGEGGALAFIPDAEHTWNGESLDTTEE